MGVAQKRDKTWLDCVLVSVAAID